jgi:signal transduction histidine kinase
MWVKFSDRDPSSTIGVFTLILVWFSLMLMACYLEMVERNLYHAQHAETATFLGSVSHELRTPIHALR